MTWFDCTCNNFDVPGLFIIFIHSFSFCTKKIYFEFFFTYEKRNSWPPRNRLSGTVRLLKERSLRNSIKLVNIYYRDTNKERFNIGVILRNVF